MTSLWGVLGIAAGLSLMILWGNLSSQNASYRFRMTVEVDTPGGPLPASSVYEVSARYRAELQPGGNKREWTERGEAVVVPLPDNRTMFALLRTGAIHEDLVGLSMTALDPAFHNDVVESASRIARGEGTRSSAVVERQLYPMMATFLEPADPRSVKEVDADNLAMSFGPGTQLRRIVVELTDEPVTTGMLARLPWLNNPAVTTTDWSRLPDLTRTVIKGLRSR